MNSAIASPGSSNGTGGGGGITQILPLKLVADKKVSEIRFLEAYV